MHKHVPVTSNSRIPYLQVSSSSSLILPLFSLHSDHVCMDPLRSGLPVPGGHEHAAAPCLGCHLHLAASARRHLEVDATLLRGCAHSHKNPSFPAVSTDSTLEADLRRPLLLSCYDQSTFLGCQRRSTCSVLSASICRKKSWDYDKCRYTIHLKLIQIKSNSYDNFTNLTLMLLNSNNFQPRQMHAAENKKTFNHFSLRGTLWNLPCSSGATWHYELFATLLRGSANSQRKPTLPAVWTGSALQANLPLHLLLSQYCWSTCSVLSASICWKDVGKATSPGTFYLKPVSGNSDSYDNFTILTMLLNSCNFQQRQINTRRRRENPSTISLSEALSEICLLQVQPLGTMQFLPGQCWDLTTVGKIHLVQQGRLAQGFKQICGAICSFRVMVEAPAMFCQNQSVQVYNNQSRSTPTHTTTSQIWPCS